MFNRILQIVAFFLLINIHSANDILLAEPASVRLTHVPFDENELPLPGEMIELKVVTEGSKYVDLPIRLIAIIDNKLIDLSMPDASITSDEKRVYSIQLPAPIENIQYQFIGFDSSKKPITSKWFILNRKCSYEASEIPVDMEQIQNSDQVNELYSLSIKLERELKAYKTSQSVLEQISTFRKNKKVEE